MYKLNLSIKQVVTGLRKLANDMDGSKLELNAPTKALQKGHYLVRHIDSNSKVSKFIYKDCFGYNYNIMKLAFDSLFGNDHQNLLRNSTYTLRVLKARVAQDNNTWFNQHDIYDIPDNHTKHVYKNCKKTIHLIKHSSPLYFIENSDALTTHVVTVKEAQFLLNRASDVIKYIAQLVTHIPENHGKVQFTINFKSSRNVIISEKLFDPYLKVSKHEQKELSIFDTVK